MSDRTYFSYLFLYDEDIGVQTIKRHRSFLNPDGITEDTPTTQLFFDRLVNTDLQVTGTSQGLRHILSYVRDRRLIAKIPYAPGDSTLIDHVREILAQPQVSCGDYIGETLVKRGSTNSF